MKRVPKLWWDFRWDYENKGVEIEALIVESDDDRYPIIAWWNLEIGCQDASSEIAKAEQLIKDINEGRKSFYKVAKQYKKEN